MRLAVDGPRTAAPTPLPRTALTQAVTTAAEHAATADRNRRLSADVARALTDAGFARHFVPHRWGGRAAGFAELLDAVAAVGEGCASAAWCAGLWAAHSRFAAYLPEEGQRELWGETCDVRITVALAAGAASAEPTANGWLLSGQWDCVSGIDHADWLLLAAADPDAQRAPVLLFAVPRSAAEVLDSWHSTGLRGTGSHSVTLTRTFVPRHRSFPLAELMRGAPGPGRSRCHTVPALLGGGLILAAPALGAARLALRTWSCAATTGSAEPGPTAREAFTRSAAEIEAARLLLHAAARKADTATVDAETVAGNQRDAAFAADLLTTAVERLFRTGGMRLATDSSELQRCWRDVHTVAAHGALRLETAAAAYASAVLA